MSGVFNPPPFPLLHYVQDDQELPAVFSCFRYLNTIQTVCPHILRYLTTAVIINKRRKTVLKDLVKVIQQVGLWIRKWVFSAQCRNECISLSVLSVALADFPTAAEYCKGFFSG